MGKLARCKRFSGIRISYYGPKLAAARCYATVIAGTTKSFPPSSMLLKINAVNGKSVWSVGFSERIQSCLLERRGRRILGGDDDHELFALRVQNDADILSFQAKCSFPVLSGSSGLGAFCLC